ncbi:MAG: 50S ribosomal protein L15 [Candidatus Peregrinibacteria bacterium]
MSLLELRSTAGRKRRKRVGRGNGSKRGTYSCRGGKGQTARTGGNIKPGFEGGQTPFLRKMPKLKGFKNPNHIEYQVVNIGQLNIFDDNAEIGRKELLEKNLISKPRTPIKLLAGKGNLEKKLTIKIDKASKEAIVKVEAQKGTVELTNKDKK